MSSKESATAPAPASASAKRAGAPCECRCRGPIHTAVRWLGWFLVAYGILLTTAWHLHWVQLVQLGPARTPIVYNTCVLLAMAGAGVLAANRCRFRATLAIGAAMLLCAAALAVPYLIAVDLGLDEALMKQFAQATEHPGRIAPNTLVCFALTAAALLGSSGRSRTRLRSLVASLLGSLIVALSLAVLLGYSTGIASASWAGMKPMAPQAAAGLFVLGLALLGLAWWKDTEGQATAPAWLPLPVTVVLVAVTLLLWHALRQPGLLHVALPTMVLILGTGMALLSGLALWLAQASGLRSRQLHKVSLYARSLIEASLDPLVTISKDGKITDVNRATEQVTGVPRSKLIGSDFCDYFTEPAQARKSYQKIFAEGQVRDYPLAIRSHSGQATDVLYNGSVFKNEAGEIEGVFAAARDITERKQAEERLREQAALLDLAHDAIIVRGLDNRIVFWSRGAADTYGFSAEEALGKIGQELLHTVFPNSLESIESSIRQIREWEGELRHLTREGKLIIVSSRWSLLRDKKGAPTAVMEINRDTTDSKRAEEGLRKASQYARSLIEASLDPLVTISKEGKITDVNQATEQVTGVPRSKLIGSDFCDYFTAPDEARKGYQKVFAEGRVRDYPLAIRSPSGRATEVLYNASLYKDERGQVQGIFAAARDITDRKRAEEELQKASRYARSLIEASLDPLVTISKEGKITDVNQATEQVTGAPRSKLIGSDFCDYFTQPGEARKGYQKVFAEGHVRDYPLAIRSPSGPITDVMYNATLFQDESGDVQGIFAAARDVTERNRAEQEIRRLNAELEDRVAARTAELATTVKDLEAFTYSVSHDLRAPLRQINGFAKLLGEDFGPSLDSKAQEYLRWVQDGTRRMGQLVDDLLNLSRVGRRELHPQLAGMSSLVKEATEDLAQETQGRQIEWQIGDLPFLECDASLMKQVWANLLSNAVKFTRTRNLARIQVGQEEREGRKVLFVRDNGVGFSMKYADKLFGVFQRLHREEDFEGTGVGLATVQRIIQKHGGRIWAEAELDKGAAFYFTMGETAVVHQSDGCPAKTAATEEVQVA